MNQGWVDAIHEFAEDDYDARRPVDKYYLNLTNASDFDYSSYDPQSITRSGMTKAFNTVFLIKHTKTNQTQKQEIKQ